VLYVALTRPRHRLVIWWGRTQECRHSPLGRLLIGRDGFTGEVGESRGSEPSGKQVRAVLDAMRARAPEMIAVEDATGGEDGSRPVTAPGRRGEGAAETLAAAAFTRSLDLRWRRTSYSGITAAAHDHGVDRVGSEPERGGVRDEPVASSSLSTRPAPEASSAAGSSVAGAGMRIPSPLGAMPGGAEVGTFVHHVLEQVDFAADDLPGALMAAVGEVAPREGPAGVDEDLVVSGLRAALTTPLGPLVGDISLSAIGRRDRLDELSFELPLGGGEAAMASVEVSAIADVLSAHLAAGDRLAGYVDRLRDPLLDSALRGYLTGSLDLVFRRADPGGRVRWYLADYKTNWLGRVGAADAGGAAGVTSGVAPGVAPGSVAGLSTWDYRADALDAEMQRRHYPLQALIYCVALHRYLRWRQPGYEPARDFGGVLYLFLRGMAGPGTPVVDGAPCGVWSWAPPPSLIVALSDLFDTGRAGGPA
jgi:exodeoxyribonuclease V beta subunit